ncbi:MAG: thioredoxin [Clostridiales bacterium]|jgi:thioredoxin 1|nr:thioredoxin [Clostridiales bacterium]
MSVVTVTQQNFEQEVLKSDKPVLVDFWAVWCGPCRMVAPILEEIAKENPGVKVAKVNVDEEQNLAMQYGVRSIPTMVLFRGGQVAKTAVGARPKASILQMLE